MIEDMNRRCALILSGVDGLSTFEAVGGFNDCCNIFYYKYPCQRLKYQKMTKFKNPYYGLCLHQKWIYAKKVALCNSYSKVRCMCKIYGVDVYTIKRPDENVMCCVSLSPYIKQNCQYFKNKKCQTMLGDFNND